MFDSFGEMKSIADKLNESLCLFYFCNVICNVSTFVLCLRYDLKADYEKRRETIEGDFKNVKKEKIEA